MMQRDYEDVPEATIARLPGYLRALHALAARGVTMTSSADLAAAAGTQPAQLRRDLSYFGNLGTRGVGYDVEHLRRAIATLIGTEAEWPIIIVGVGNLGSALAGQFMRPPFRVVALVDSNPQLIGKTRSGVEICSQDRLLDAVARTKPAIGVVAVTPDAAQSACDALVEAGVASILNFAPTVLTFPDWVHLRTVDLSQELQILAYHEHHRRLETGVG